MYVRAFFSTLLPLLCLVFCFSTAIKSLLPSPDSISRQVARFVEDGCIERAQRKTTPHRKAERASIGQDGYLWTPSSRIR